ncbi:class 1 fructose-bisphosphatase [Anaerolineae bacterium CFX9]|jgi:fructose-1,6-bisphosphatase I|nr:class 1 fructose-bisphosphatase [Oscillatoria laete-virens]MDL1901677.1 class 1 fructose-bisphosphatase [Anaerolineae bacterium CFX9]
MALLTTIERHILDQQARYPNATGELTSLLYDMALAAKIIARETTRAGLAGILGTTENTNIYDEHQQKLDLFADEMIYKMNDHTRRLCAMASEEHAELIDIPRHFGTGKYVLLYDPLDGSSNIDVNVSVGTIFSIHRKITDEERGTLDDVLQPGHRLVAAGYVIYGSSTMMVYSTGQGVHGFTLDPSVGEFLLSHHDIRFPEKAKFYSVNQGHEKYWTHGVRRFTRWLQGIDGEGHEPLSGRYVGSLVADFHRNLLQGGVFYYPGDLRKPEKPFGKLRLMFEAQALAFIAHHAGGYASDGLGSVLDIQPHFLHQRCPFFCGNRYLVEKAEQLIAQHDADWIAAYEPYRNMVRAST